MASLLDRYRAGESEQVWAELLALGAAVRTESLWSDAIAVARETMRRARENIELLVSRLQAVGYQFNTTYGLQPWTAPGPDASARIAALEQLVGPIPLSVRAWYEAVGSANLLGSHPDWTWPGTFVRPDPLVIYPIEWLLEDCAERMQDVDWQRSEGHEQNYLILAPDDYHKEDVSGGPAYAIDVPNPAADAVILYEWHNTTFVSYLRTCFRWGGFPGFERYQERPTALLTDLARGLAPI